MPSCRRAEGGAAIIKDGVFQFIQAEGKKESFGVCQGVIIILGHGILDGHWRPSMMGSTDSGSSEAKGLIPWASWSY